MFFLPLLNGFLLLYILAALLPAFFLMRYIYRIDTVEKEPAGLLAALFFRGILAALLASVIEMIAQAILDHSAVEQGSVSYVAILAFLIVAVAEEGMKFIHCYRRTWSEPNFDCRFDGIVYMAFVSLGFAAFENVLYVFQFGLSVALPRALLSVPGHLGFAVVAGALYGRAKDFAIRGMEKEKTTCLVLSYISSVLLHGFYDTCAMLQTTAATVVFFIFVALMYLFIIRLLKRESKTDFYFNGS